MVCRSACVGALRGALLGILIGTLGVMGVSSLASAQEMRFFRIGTGGVAGTYYPIGGLIADIISHPPGARPCNRGGSCGVPGLVGIAQSSNGSVANVNAISPPVRVSFTTENSSTIKSLYVFANRSCYPMICPSGNTRDKHLPDKEIRLDRPSNRIAGLCPRCLLSAILFELPTPIRGDLRVNTSLPTYPKLRPVEVFPTYENGRQILVLHDPTGMADGSISVTSQAALYLFQMMDGQHDIDALGSCFEHEFGESLPRDQIEEIVTQLDTV